MVWTRFMDMHSGGRQKLEWAYIYIEAPEENAAKVFMRRFDRNPNHITCSCCGEDYSYWEGEEEWMLKDMAEDSESKLIIRASEITPEDLIGETPRRGHLVWVED